MFWSKSTMNTMIEYCISMSGNILKDQHNMILKLELEEYVKYKNYIKYITKGEIKEDISNIYPYGVIDIIMNYV